ncbi:potassium efflux system protein [Agaricicola taiwanensis]|uniref:Potassium efflux system protein n=1 Tax=Agaricicola taiwanensis TaxID=591372 RepID=A0A8J2YLM8_9RHOB|nr:monovalent cation:proton antiporter-2 (CPA2) family protein [Agaricicola taiwanensis]GGE53430.1 potassium efflux system protein [Agaricicola taiwanensis]
MAVEGQGFDLVQVVALLGAGVVAVPLFRKLGLGTVLGYFSAGIVIGPFGLGLFSDPETILHTAELGVIMLLFIIGLEMQPVKLWHLRREIFGLGAAQVVFCGALLTLAGVAAGLSTPVALVAGMGFVLSSTAVVMQMLDEWGETSTPLGQRAVSILLLEDLSIVPLLALVTFIAPMAGDGGGSRWQAVAIGLGAVVGLIVIGRWLLNPMFSVLAAARAREVMTAAALLVVLGSALLMQVGGLSMAMGAFLAGVLLSESSFRHELEADIEPFRGILLGIFFIAVGMSLNLAAVAADWMLVAAAVVAFTLIKSFGIYVVARLFGAGNREAVDRVTLFAQGGEFAFVLYSAALAGGIFDGRQNAIFTATVIISMALTPVIASVVHRLRPAERQTFDGIDKAQGLASEILMIGFGRFGQIVSQSLLARGYSVNMIENDVEMIRAASTFGFKIYYGDGTRIDILRASGAADAAAILVCIDDKAAATRIAQMIRREFPLTPLFVNAYDRGHALELIEAGVDYQIRETFESAMTFGAEVLRRLGVPDEEVDDIQRDVRRRDEERLALQVSGGINAGSDLIRSNGPVPAPLTVPKRPGQVIGDVPKSIAEEGG